MNKTKIDWCTHTVNPVVGCTHGCTYCYAKRMNDRFNWIEDWSKPEFFPERLKSLKSKKPKIIFMNSMSDIADWKEVWIEQIFKIVNENPQHKYLFLTKRPKEYGKLFRESKLLKTSNVWYGTTITKSMQDTYTPNTLNTFVSIEPIHGPIDFLVAGDKFFKWMPKWVIVGAETGNKKDKVIPKKEWILDIKEQCRNAGVPIFMKESLRVLMGIDFIQEFPWVQKC